MAVLSVLALAACSSPQPPPPAGDYYVYGSAEELVGASDLIVHGIVVGTQVQQSQARATIPATPPPATSPPATSPARVTGPRVVVTIVRLTVIDVFKGDVAVGDEIEVSQLGGRYRGVDYVDAGTTLLQVGQAGGYVLLLRRGPDGVYYLPNPQQAMFTLAGEAGLSGIGANALDIATPADLRALAAVP